MSDPSGPSLWEVMAVDPSIPIDEATLRLVIRDQRGRSRTLLYPWVRILSRVAVTVIAGGKWAFPVRFSAHATMDRMCLWFLRRFVSPDAVSLLIRHFIVESNLLNFCVRNADVPGVPEVSLRPTTLAGLGNRAVIEHDLNVYRVLFALGIARARTVTPAIPGTGTPGTGTPGTGTPGTGTPGHRDRASLDFSMLGVPPIDPERHTRRFLALDIQTALCLMNIPFAFCLTPAQYRRAVHSLRLDTSLLHVLAGLTGDTAFLGWGTRPPPVRVNSNADVPAMVYDHAVLCEYAHARLCQLSQAAMAQARP